MDIKLAVFKVKEIRRALHNNEWWFSTIDVVGTLTESERPRKYWSDLKKKLSEEGYSELSEKIVQPKLKSTDGKFYETEDSNFNRKQVELFETAFGEDLGKPVEPVRNRLETNIPLQASSIPHFQAVANA